MFSHIYRVRKVNIKTGDILFSGADSGVDLARSDMKINSLNIQFHIKAKISP